MGEQPRTRNVPLQELCLQVLSQGLGAPEAVLGRALDTTTALALQRVPASLSLSLSQSLPITRPPSPSFPTAAAAAAACGRGAALPAPPARRAGRPGLPAPARRRGAALLLVR